MVKINELPESLQRKIRELKSGIEHIANRSCDPRLPSIAGSCAYYSIMGFIEGEDSWHLVKKEINGMKNLKDFICKDGRVDLLRDFEEIEKSLEELTTENPYL